MNDLFILKSSSIVEKTINRKLLPTFEHEGNKNPSNLCNYLVDGIHQNWDMFIDTITEAINKKKETFFLCPEGRWERCGTSDWRTFLKMRHDNKVM